MIYDINSCNFNPDDEYIETSHLEVQGICTCMHVSSPWAPLVGIGAFEQGTHDAAAWQYLSTQ